MNSSILVRVTLVNAAFATSKQLLLLENNMAQLIIASVFANSISIYLIRKTRTLYVLGPKPNFESGRMKDKVVLITGANTGIGKETASQLLNLGATVIFACRSERRAKDAMKDIQLGSNKEEVNSITGRMRFLELDLSDTKSIRTAAQTFNNMDLSLDVLINNAGILMGDHKKNKDGYELMMACNHLGHFLLTNLLLPKLRESKEPRVLTLSSSTYAMASHMDLQDLFCENKRGYTLFGQYAQSKLANILFTKELAKRDPNILCCAVHPGLVKTDVIKNLPWFLKLGYALFGFIISTFQKTAPAGAYTSVYCAVANEVKSKNGLYYVNSAVQEVTKAAMDEKVRLFIYYYCHNETL